MEDRMDRPGTGASTVTVTPKPGHTIEWGRDTYRTGDYLPRDHPAVLANRGAWRVATASGASAPTPVPPPDRPMDDED